MNNGPHSDSDAGTQPGSPQVPGRGAEPAAPARGRLQERERLPRIAIVGRPNVGKSTLLNRLCGSRVAIVEPTAGVTRDRISVPARLDTEDGPRWVEVIDTGGLGIVDRDDLGPHVEAQVDVAVRGADLVLFLVDVRDGLTPLDMEVATRLRRTKLPVLLAVNKCEGRALEWDVDAFLRMGVGDEHFAISAQNGEGLDPLFNAIVERLPWAPSERREEAEPVLKIAVVGRRNAGKSTLVNRLAGEERMIVSEIPGTTRDAVDVVFERRGERFIVIDTAGVRKQTKFADAIEFFSDARAKKSVRRADVVILLFDVTQPLSAIEKTLARFAVDRHKPLVLGANKWDLVEDRVEPEKFREYLDAQMPGMNFVPIVFLSAKEGARTDELISVARDLLEQGRRRVSTGELNRVLEQALQARQPNSRGYRVRVKYATQVDVSPPTFVLFVNDRKHIGKDWLRYLTNRIRQDLPFPEVPVRIVVKDKHSAEEDDESNG
ncbi:MAG: ribosome biogenesis GTPase Der [Planctomycetota bacterium]